jgi:hypothetical protein
MADGPRHHLCCALADLGRHYGRRADLFAMALVRVKGALKQPRPLQFFWLSPRVVGSPGRWKRFPSYCIDLVAALWRPFASPGQAPALNGDRLSKGWGLARLTRPHPGRLEVGPDLGAARRPQALHTKSGSTSVRQTEATRPAVRARGGGVRTTMIPAID